MDLRENIKIDNRSESEFNSVMGKTCVKHLVDFHYAWMEALLKGVNVEPDGENARIIRLV